MRIAAYLLILMTIGCGGSGQDASPRSLSPGEANFYDADDLIGSSSDGLFHGNTEEAAEMAKLFSEAMKGLAEELFTGGKKDRIISLTDEEFLTYCRLNESSVVFLVHVPQFKRYKGEVRDSLLELTWMVAQRFTEADSSGELQEIAIGLRGSMMYGGTAIGDASGTPTYENAFRVDKDVFYPYFADSDKVAEDNAPEQPAETGGPALNDDPVDSEEQANDSEEVVEEAPNET